MAPDGERRAIAGPGQDIELNMLALDGPELKVLQGLAQIYAAQTGCRVQVLGASYEELFEQLTNAEYTDVFDIFRLDVAWLSWFAGRVLLDLAQVDDDVSEKMNAYLPASVDKYCHYGGGIYALPLTPSPQLLFYRKDLFEALENRRLYYESTGRDLKAPETFQEYNEIARFFMESLQIGRNGMSASTLTTGNTSLAATEYLSRFFSRSDRLFDESGNVLLNTEPGRQALDEMIALQAYSLQGNSKWWTDSVQDFAQGRAAMMITFANYASEILRTDSRIIGRIGYAMVPGRNPICGGGSVGVSRNSKRPEESLRFITWLTNAPASSLMAAMSGVSPCSLDYRIGETVRTFPWMGIIEECLNVSTARKTPEGCQAPFNEKRMDNIIGAAVKNALAGLYSPEQALRFAEDMLRRQRDAY